MKWLITGGAGFNGTNVVQRLIKEGHQVIVLDNLRRPGVRYNLQFLREHFQFDFIEGDIRESELLVKLLKEHPDTYAVLHLAAQVAVTDSISDPTTDFQINAAGTLNLCEAIRQCAPQAILLNASTNKVYGELTHLNLQEGKTRYLLTDRPNGISKEEALDFRTPSGCSKRTAEQYVRDYARTYGLRTVSFRQSCIYGKHQFGVEDQGWVAWFLIAATLGKPIKICGNGKQVRDLLFVQDLVDCYLAAVDHIEHTTGEIYNVGGGPTNTCSLLELIGYLELHAGKESKHTFEDWRPGDQRVFICDIRKAVNDFGWKPTTSVTDGLGKLWEWVHDSRTIIRKILEG